MTKNDAFLYFYLSFRIEKNYVISEFSKPKCFYNDYNNAIIRFPEVLSNK